jgi:cytochrome c-type biogenesis protein CcmE
MSTESARPSAQPDRRPAWKRTAPGLLIALLCVDAALLSWFFAHDGDERVYLRAVAQALENPGPAGRNLRVYGALAPGSLIAYTNPVEYRFKLRDSQHTSVGAAPEMEVLYAGEQLPDTLRELEGRPAELHVQGRLHFPGYPEPTFWSKLAALANLEVERLERHPSPAPTALHFDATALIVRVHGAYELIERATAQSPPHTQSAHPSIRPIPTVHRSAP